jgi:DNA-binding GntR family transcriptional regulator
VSSPKHAQLAETLRQRIVDGEYPVGTKIPSEAKLTAESGASRTTVRQALITLQNQGLLRAESGVGYFVRKPAHFSYRPQDDFQRRTFITGADSFTQAVAKDGRESSQRIDVAMVAAPDDVRRRMGLDVGEFVVRRNRLRFIDGEAHQLNVSYYPRDVAEGTEIMTPQDITRGANQVLADRGHAQVEAFDEIWIRMPYPDETDSLRILPGTPVAEHIITGFTAEGRVVRMVRVVLPGDRNVITFERTHPDHESEQVE